MPRHDEPLVFLNADPDWVPSSSGDLDDLQARWSAIEKRKKLRTKWDTHVVIAGTVGLVFGVIGFFLLPVLFGALSLAGGVFAYVQNRRKLAWGNFVLGGFVLSMAVFFIPAMEEIGLRTSEATNNLVTSIEMEMTSIYATQTAISGEFDFDTFIMTPVPDVDLEPDGQIVAP